MWTLHDMWAFTGGCHYSGVCSGYEIQCGNCPFLKHPYENDLSHKVWKQKEEIMQDFSNLTIVTCSSWLRGLASQSSLFKTKNVLTIPNCIDTQVFFPQDKVGSRKALNLPQSKKLILFGAMNTADKRKGFIYLIEALAIMKIKYPQYAEQISLVVFGKSDPEVLSNLAFSFNDLQVISSEKEMIDAYSAADVFVIPSLEDNLPNTIMESLACGVPVVAFQTGGIPEMVSHKNTGYIAKYMSSEALADGIYWTLFESNTHDLAGKCREKVLAEYSMEVVAAKYLKLYQELNSTNN